MKNFLDVAKEAAKEAGKILKANVGKITSSQVQLKKRGDYVTRVDKEAEQKILSIIKKTFPQHSFLSEEAGSEKRDSEYQWVIDPLDGTTNYIHSYPFFCVSIALQKGKETIIGVVYDPLREELFWAEKGKGAYLNGKPIKVSDLKDMPYALLATGFPFRARDILGDYLKYFRNVFLSSSGIRRAGSAALDLCYTACGRVDGFWEMKLSAWDVAAGSLLVQEAGGIVSDFSGGDKYLTTGDVIAGNSSVHQQLLEILKK